MKDYSSQFSGGDILMKVRFFAAEFYKANGEMNTWKAGRGWEW